MLQFPGIRCSSGRRTWCPVPPEPLATVCYQPISLARHSPAERAAPSRERLLLLAQLTLSCVTEGILAISLVFQQLLVLAPVQRDNYRQDNQRGILKHARFIWTHNVFTPVMKKNAHLPAWHDTVTCFAEKTQFKEKKKILGGAIFGLTGQTPQPGRIRSLNPTFNVKCNPAAMSAIKLFQLFYPPHTPHPAPGGWKKFASLPSENVWNYVNVTHYPVSSVGKF